MWFGLVHLRGQVLLESIELHAVLGGLLVRGGAQRGREHQRHLAPFRADDGRGPLEDGQHVRGAGRFTHHAPVQRQYPLPVLEHDAAQQLAGGITQLRVRLAEAVGGNRIAVGLPGHRGFLVQLIGPR